MIYVEEEIQNHPRTLLIRGRFPDDEVVSCARYGEVFNRRAQSFRLQKRRPSLILAKKPPLGAGAGSVNHTRRPYAAECFEALATSVAVPTDAA